MKINAVIIHPKDNVATAIVALKNGGVARVIVASKIFEILLCDDIPYGHKFAIADIKVQGNVYKYGESIGRATQNIRRGDYVHIHNVESERGRGDRV